jgi:threonine dehydratase
VIRLKQIQEAKERIGSTVVATPLFSSRTINEEIGNRLWLKGEHLQKTGSFKIRGAANMVTVEAQKGSTHVVAASSGNHGQAVASVARMLGLKATIVVPVDVARCKAEAIYAYGAEIVYCGTTSMQRLQRAQEICRELTATYIPPYDDPQIIAGQGTVGLEMMEQLEEIDEVYVPVGGGGLLSGIATAIKEVNPHIRVIGVEPALANDTYLSIKAGKRVLLPATPTIADGLRTSTPGELTFPLVQRYVDDIQTVSEEQIVAALRLIFTRMKQVIEPSGAVSVAAALEQEAKGKRMLALVSGGNIDPQVASMLLN